MSSWMRRRSSGSPGAFSAFLMARGYRVSPEMQPVREGCVGGAPRPGAPAWAAVRSQFSRPLPRSASEHCPRLERGRSAFTPLHRSEAHRSIVSSLLARTLKRPEGRAPGVVCGVCYPYRAERGQPCPRESWMHEDGRNSRQISHARTQRSVLRVFGQHALRTRPPPAPR
jgi:hypothetical protein